MKYKIQIRAILIAGVLLTTIDHGIAQPKITFSDLSPFNEQPIILGQTPNNYFCLYPNDSTPELVIYNPDLKEESRIDWYSLAAPKPGITYQPFILGNGLVVLAHEKTSNIVTVSCKLFNEKGQRISEKILFSDYSYKGQLNQPYAVEVSKNGKYIVLYRAAKLDEKTILLKGYLFDSDWNSIKQFAVPMDKNETDDAWDGAVVDIEGNIHSIVYTIADSWKLGSTISVYTIPKNADEAKAEKIEVLKKRLFNYSVNEDTGSHSIRLQATLSWQHRKDALAGIAFIDIPYSRTKKIKYDWYQFTPDQKKQLAKNITAEKALLTNTNIEFPSSFMQGGSFFTSINVYGNDPNAENLTPGSEKKSSPGMDELYIADRLNRGTYRGDTKNAGNGQGAFLNDTNKFLNRQRNFASTTQRIILLKNNNRGILESFITHTVKKASVPFYDDRLFSIVKNDSLQLMGYLMDLNGPALYLLTDKKDSIKKILTPGNNFVLFSQPCRINDNSSLFPFTNIKTGKYGLAKIIF